MTVSVLRGSATRIQGATNITLGNAGPAGPAYPLQLFNAGKIDTPTLDASIDFLQAPAADATDAANAAAALANQKAALAVTATAGAQAVIDASPAVMTARDQAVSAAGTATTAAASVAGSVTDIARMSPQLGPAYDPAELSADWLDAITTPDGLYAFLSFLASSGMARVNGLFDASVGVTAGEDAGPFPWWSGTPDAAAIALDAVQGLLLPGMGATEVARLLALGGALTAAALQVSGALQARDMVDLGFDPTATSVGEDAGAMAWWLGIASRAPIGLDGAGNLLLPGLSVAEAARIIALAGITPGAGYTAPTTLRDGRMLIDPVQGTDFLFGKVQGRDGFLTPVKQRNAGTNAVALSDHPGKALICLTYGQSNAGFGGTFNLVSRKIIEALYPYNTFGMSKAGALYTITSGPVVDDGTEDDFLPLVDQGGAFVTAGYPATQSIMTAFGAEMAFRARGRTSAGILHHLDWYGGNPLNSFVKGTQLYTNLIQHAGLLGKLAFQKYGRQVAVPAVHLIQGESGPYDGTWLTLATQLVSDMRTDILAATSAYGATAAPLVMVQQTNVNDNTSSNTYPSAQTDQIALCRNSPTTTAMVGPSYFAPVPDVIHTTPEGRAMIGEVAGEVFRVIADGGTWAPLWSTIITGQNGGYRCNRVGNVITVQYTRFPTGMEVDGGGIAVGSGWIPGANDGWVKPVPNSFYGFDYSDSAGNTITSVVITTDTAGYMTQAVITLSADPSAASNRVLTYARKAFDSASDGWASNRGQLRARIRKSRFREEGLNIPQFIYAYACCEEWRTGDAGVNL